MMKRLIEGQKIIIDDHRRGMPHACFDDETADIHLDKKAVSGSYRIRVPLNTNRPVCVEIKGKCNRIEEVPEQIAREIREVFEDMEKRRRFVEDLVDELKNFPYSDEEKENGKESAINKAFSALRRISQHFGLNWSNRTVRIFLKEYKIYGMRYMATITDGPSLYYLSVDMKRFVFADYMMIGLTDRNTWNELEFGAFAQ